MLSNGPEMPSNAGRQRAKTRFLTLADIDGRTLAAKRAHSIVAAIKADVGVDLSEAERQLAQRAGVLGAFLEDAEARWISGEPFDLGLYCTGLNAQRRVLEVLGIKRVPRDISVLEPLDYAKRIEAAE
jgi:hypothetical protein